MKLYTCGNCGRKAPAEKLVYSRHTGARYCLDLGPCLRAAARRKAKRERVSA